MRRWKWIPLAAVVGAVIGVAVAKLLVQRNYTAATVLVWEPSASRVAGSGERDLTTRVKSVLLPSNLLEVRRRLGLNVPLKVLERRAAVRAEPNSNLVTITASDAHAGPAAALADTLVEVFLEHEMRLAQARAQEQTQKLEADLDVARTKLGNARETYDAFRTEHGIADLAVETQLAIQHVAELRSSADQARAEAEALQARAVRLDAEAKRQSTHQMQGASQSDPVKAQLATATAELVALRARLAEDHPSILALEAQVHALQKQVEAGGTVTTSAVTIGLNPHLEALKSTLTQSAADREAAVQRQEVYKRFAAEAELRLQRLSSVEGQASALLANIKLFEDRVTRIEAELVVAGDEARSIRPEFRALAPAMVPEEAESARKKVAAAAPVFAALICLLVLVGIELRGFKIMTATEAAFWIKGPAVASSRWPEEADMFQPLMDELADYAPLSKGTTLVLGATDAEAPLAREVAYWLSTLHSADKAAMLPTGSDPEGAVAAASAGSPEITALVPTTAATGGTGRHAAHTWEGGADGQAIRRAARLASRVLIVLRSGSVSMLELGQIHARLGRDQGIGVMVVGLDEELMRLRDRVGEVEAFWRTEHVEAQT